MPSATPDRPRRDLLTWCLLCAAAVALALLHWVGGRLGIPFPHFSRDPLAVARAPVHYGLLSNLGVLVWTAGAACALLAAGVLRGGAASREESRFLAWAGVGTVYLALDDLYLLHENVYPNELGLLERWVLPAYGVAALVLGWRFRRTLLSAWRLPLVLACGFFAGSLGVDKIDEDVLGAYHHLFEDGFKFLGALAWTIFLVHRSGTALRGGGDG